MASITRKELRKMIIKEMMQPDLGMSGEVIDMSNPMRALRSVMSAISSGRPFVIKVDGGTLSVIGRVFNVPVEPGPLDETVHPGYIIAGVALVILLGLIAYGIHKGYGIRLRGGGGVGGDTGPRGEGEVIFAPGGQEIPDTSMGKEPKEEEDAAQQKALALMGMI